MTDRPDLRGKRAAYQQQLASQSASALQPAASRKRPKNPRDVASRRTVPAGPPRVCDMRPTDARGNEREETSPVPSRAAARSFVYSFLAVRVGSGVSASHQRPLLLGGELKLLTTGAGEIGRAHV